MKRLSLIAVALVALLAIGFASMAAGSGDVKKVKAKITLAYDPPSNRVAARDSIYGEDSGIFHGKAKTKKICRKKRKVVIKGVGKAKTNKKGFYSIDGGPNPAPGQYRAKLKKKTVKKHGTTYKCKPAKSKPVTVS
jgi:hypothetical protein